jgi:hypothetical protein
VNNAWSDFTPDCSEVLKVKVKLSLSTPCRRIVGVKVQLHSFLTLALQWLTSHPGRFFSPGNNPGTHWIGGWVGPRAGLDVLEKR